MFSFKEKLSNKVVDTICPIGERAKRLCEDEEDFLLEVLDKGAKHANSVASTTLASLKEQVGILRRQF